MPMTAILPAPAETGSSVPLAVACRRFDGPESGRSIIDRPPETLHVALRGQDGLPLDASAVSEAFAGAVRGARGRPIIYLTHGTKTGMVAPAETPAGVEVIVDACQLRLPRSAVRDYLDRGWPVVITGSKFLGGPAFSGAVLLPAGRFPAAVGTQARRVCARAAPSASAGWADPSAIGPLLRWSAALAGLDRSVSGDDVADAVRRLEHEATAAVGCLSGARIIEQAAGRHGIVTFAVEDRGMPGSWLGVDALRGIYRGLAEQGVLVGQPVDLGPFGGLRVAIGMRDVLRGSIEASLHRLAQAWPVARVRQAKRVEAAGTCQGACPPAMAATI